MAKKEDFDAQTVNVLDQIATLLKVARNLRSRQTFFINNLDLNDQKVKPDVRLITKFASTTGTQLLGAVFKKDKERAAAIENVQRCAFKELSAAVAVAERLAEMENDAMRNLGLERGVITFEVVRPLRDMQEAWAGSYSSTNRFINTRI